MSMTATKQKPKKKSKDIIKIVVHFLGRVLCLVHCYFYDLVPMGFSFFSCFFFLLFCGVGLKPKLRANFWPTDEIETETENSAQELVVTEIFVLSQIIGWHCLFLLRFSPPHE